MQKFNDNALVCSYEEKTRPSVGLHYLIHHWWYKTTSCFTLRVHSAVKTQLGGRLLIKVVLVKHQNYQPQIKL